MPANFLVLDVGSTRLKAALYNAEGQETAFHSADSPLQQARPKAGELFDTILLAANHVCGDLRPDAIAITGATRTNVFTAADGSALGPIVKLDDARGANFEQDIRAAYREPDGRGMGAFHPLARLLDCKTTQPDMYAAMQWELEIKDWLNLQLVGVARTDAVAQARLAPRHTTLSEALQHLELRSSLQPAPMLPAQVVGIVNASRDHRLAAWQGVPVVQCGFDAWCASFGMGCVQDGHVYNVSGTTEVFGSFTRVDRILPGVSSLGWTPELYHLGGPCLTGLATLAWFGRTFLNDSNPQAVMDCAARAGPDVPLCLPFVSGERMPFWRGDLSAQFIDLRSPHGLPEMARALLDGLMVFQRYLVAMLCPEARTIHMSGGATGLTGWMALKADSLGLPAQKCLAAEPSLLGAAMACLAATDAGATLEGVQARWVPAYETTLPDRQATQRLLAIEKRLLPQLLALHKMSVQVVKQ